MPDATFPADRPSESICPWCSANVTPETTSCPSCGAILISDVETELPGLTAVDATAAKAESKPKGRSWLPSWISGEHADDLPSASDLQAIAPPDRNVQREIQRLALEAEVASLQAEVEARYAEAVAEGRVRQLPDQPDESSAADDPSAAAENTQGIDGVEPNIDSAERAQPGQTDTSADTDTTTGTRASADSAAPPEQPEPNPAG